MGKRGEILPKHKRSQSQIISTVLLILLVLAAIVIVSNVVMNLVKKSGKQVSTQPFTTNIEVKNPLYLQNGDAKVKVKLTKGEINGLRFILYDEEGNSYPIDETTKIPGLLETKEYIFSSTQINNKKISKVEVIPFSGDVGSESFGIPIKSDVNEVTYIGKSCQDIYDNGYASGNGIYSIDPEADGTTINVYCDMVSTPKQGKIIEVIAQQSIYTYNNHPSHYLGWPLYVDQEFWFVDPNTGLKLEQIVNPTTKGEVDFKITNCTNDGTYTGCTALKIGSMAGACEDGILKNYGDFEFNPSTWKTVYDNNYTQIGDEECSTGNPRIIYFVGPYDHTSGKKTRIVVQNFDILGYGKRQLCVKYTNTETGLTAEKCIEFISEYINMDLVGAPTLPNKNFGDIFSWSVSNIRTRYDNQLILPNYVEKKCSIQPWYNGFKDPRTITSPTLTVNRHETQENYNGYLGLFFGIKNTEPAGEKIINAEVKFPSTCFLRDRDGNSDYSFYHNDCDWYHKIDGIDKSVYCCKDTITNTYSWKEEGLQSGFCDKFTITGKEGGTLSISNKIDTVVDNYDDTRVYMECPGRTAFGNDADKYTVTTDSQYFYVNDMDYSSEIDLNGKKTFSEALLDSRYETNTNDFSCNNLKLNFCGRAYVNIQLLDYYEVYGIKSPTTTGSICVKDPVKCLHTTC